MNINVSCFHTYGQSLIQIWKENLEVYWSYEFRITLFSYGAIFPMENSVQNFSNQQAIINGMRYLKSVFIYIILNNFSSNLECKIFKICNYWKWSKVSTRSYSIFFTCLKLALQRMRCCMLVSIILLFLIL